jgi:uncharacterized protein (DUF58 family)
VSSLPLTFTPKFLKQLEKKQISSRKNFLGRKQGGHYSLKKGHGIEFADYRKYQLGDDPRHIDWNLQARSERTYIKRFREEQDLMIHLIIDNSLSMSVSGDSTEDHSKWQRVKELSLAIAYLASMQHDVLQVSTVGGFNAKKYSGKQLIYSLAKDLNELEFYQGKGFFSELKKSCLSVKYPGVAYFISDFLVESDELIDFLTYLTSKNVDLNLVQVLSRTEINPQIASATCIDIETKQEINLTISDQQLDEYQKLLREHNEQLRKLAARRQIAWHSFCADQDLLNCINQVI